jgi:hypothetical protein
MKKYLFIFLIIQSTGANVFRQLAVQWHKSFIVGLSTNEQSIVRNWIFLKAFQKFVAKNTYMQVLAEYDKQTKSIEMHALTHGQFQETNVGKAIGEAERLSENYFDGEKKILFIEMFNKVKD